MIESMRQRILQNPKRLYLFSLILGLFLGAIFAGYGMLEVLTAFLVLVTGAYVFLTYGLLEEAQRSRVLQYKPALVLSPYVDLNHSVVGYGKFILSIKNGGFGPALDIRIDASYKSKGGNKHLLLRFTDILNPKEEVTHSLFSRKRMIDRNAKEVEIVLEYKDISGHQYVTREVLYAKRLMYSLNLKSPSKTEQALEKIASALSDIEKKMGD